MNPMVTHPPLLNVKCSTLSVKRSHFPPFFATRLAALLALLAAGWPVLRWYAARLGDGSDEPWGLVALATALFFAPWRAILAPLPPHRTLALCTGLALYAAAYPWMPPLIRAVLFVTLIALVIVPTSTAHSALYNPQPAFSPLPFWSLLVLSLPVVATLQFYLGYPLRVITTHLSVPLIKLGGVTATATGTTLTWSGERVIVDAPCSGIQMLWTGLFCAAALACWHRHDTRRTLRLAHTAALAVFIANILRATALFFTETGRWPAPPWAHDAIGLALFALAALVILFAAERLAPQPVVPSLSPNTPASEHLSQRRPLPSPPPLARLALLVLLLLLAAAAAAPVWSAHIMTTTRATLAARAATAFPGWHAASVEPAISANWIQLSPDAREARFAKDFPGTTAVFTDDTGRIYILRWLSHPTRRLHPAAHCLRALGYDTSPRPIHQKTDGTLWSATEATRNGHTLLVHERILATDGRAWTDVSAWYWTATLARTPGPWWTITELVPQLHPR
ncbi:exosortase/archaeosortase family protein [Opitutaceae bacterium TAV3]|nr:exosortase/archaeosortase family protein [Opitutaceae bacterium TAV3]